MEFKHLYHSVPREPDGMEMFRWDLSMKRRRWAQPIQNQMNYGDGLMISKLVLSNWLPTYRSTAFERRQNEPPDLTTMNTPSMKTHGKMSTVFEVLAA